jgi:hypothetical protein
MRCRVWQSWAGKGWGGMVIPRVGMEVLVEFLDRYPDQPLVTGCVYNGRNSTPYPLPSAKTKSVFKTNTHKGLHRNNHIPPIATTREALRDQYFENEAQWLAPWGSHRIPQDYDPDASLSPSALPEVFGSDGAGLNAWEIHTGRFRYHGDADAKMIAIVLFIREVDVPFFKEYPNGFNTVDVIGAEPGFLSRAWRWITE